MTDKNHCDVCNTVTDNKPSGYYKSQIAGEMTLFTVIEALVQDLEDLCDKHRKRVEKLIKEMKKEESRIMEAEPNE